MLVALLDKPAQKKQAPQLIVQSSDFRRIFHLYTKLQRVKLFLDEIAEEFIDAKSVRMCHFQGDSVQYRVVVEYDNHQLNRLSKLANPRETLT